MADQTTNTPDPRYPIGKFSKPASFTPELRAENIAVIEQLPETLRSIVSEWSVAQLDTPYREGGWTARQLIHHIADSHLVMTIRFRVALTQPPEADMSSSANWPTIMLYSEKLWAELPDAKSAPVDLSLTLIESLHARFVLLLRSLTEQQWQLGFIYPERGPYDLQTILAIYAWHSRHHTAHLTALAKHKGWSA